MDEIKHSTKVKGMHGSNQEVREKKPEMCGDQNTNFVLQQHTQI